MPGVVLKCVPKKCVQTGTHLSTTLFLFDYVSIICNFKKNERHVVLRSRANANCCATAVKRTVTVVLQ
jgi:hypothetical protein